MSIARWCGVTSPTRTVSSTHRSAATTAIRCAWRSSSTASRRAPGIRCSREYRDPAEASALECRLESGRTHQIRVHLAAIGHPVVGDGTYGGIRHGIALAAPVPARGRAAFVHPITNETMSFTSPLPDDLAARRGSAHNVARPVLEPGFRPRGDAASGIGNGLQREASSSRLICSPADFQIASSTH